MSSKGKQIFIMPAEFVEWVRELTTSLHEHVVLQTDFQKALKHWGGTAESLLAADRIHFTGDLANLEGLRSSDIIPGLLGWVQLDVPRIQGSCLFLVMLAGKSDWYDRNLRQVLEKRDALKRYDRIWRRWKPRVFTPMLVRDIPTGVGRLYSSVGYSAGAAEWVRQGGILRQEGVANNEYLLPDQRIDELKHTPPTGGDVPGRRSKRST
jgi:hypothetical protein